MAIADIPILAMLRTRMQWQQQRQQVLAQNVANADTPGFQPEDLKPFTLKTPARAGALRPVLTQPEIRRDTVRLLRAAAADRNFLVRASSRLPGWDRPALVVWASGDRVMPPEHGRRLAGLLPDARLLEIPDSYTLMPLDQPAQLAEAIREFTSSITKDNPTPAT